uniref:Putative presegetalin G1 n=1 Tax=Gypsophila vaccaria TaxID=39387 RepID=F6LNM5_GYPVA|nr:putative presegetalin G1 [Gypsophila vaccaria]
MSPIFVHEVVKPQGVKYAFQPKDSENASAPV